MSAVLPVEIRRAIVAHARAALPNEACGLIVGTGHLADGGVALRFVPARSLTPSPWRYEIDPDDLVRITLAADAAGEVTWGIVHSHPSSEARPSPTDIARAFDSKAVHLIVSLAPSAVTDTAASTPGASDGAISRGAATYAARVAEAASHEVEIRAWRIAGGKATEVALDPEA